MFREEHMNKQLSKGLVLAGTLLAASTAFSYEWEDITPILGVEGDWTWVRLKEDSGSLFPKNYWGVSPYIGIRWCDFGIEGGYDWYFRKHQSHSFSAGSRVLGVTVPAGDSWRSRGRIRLDGWHMDFLGYLNLSSLSCLNLDCFDFSECVDLIASAGFAWRKPHAHVDFTDHLGRTEGVSYSSGHGKVVLRLGAGAQYMITEMVGIRALVRWENDNSYKMLSTDFSGTIPAFTANFSDILRLRDTVTGALGAFVKF